MPTYFFDLRTPTLDIPDPEGTELRDEASAREHARTVVLELMKHREMLTRSWRIDVRDGENRQRFELHFANIQNTTLIAPGTKPALDTEFSTGMPRSTP